MGGANPGGRAFTIPLARVQRLLLAALILVAGLGLLAELLRHGSAGAGWDAPIVLLSLSEECNLPTWYASSLLLSCAAALALVAAATPRQRGSLRGYWLALALMFVYMSIDEAVGIHEHLNGLIDGRGALTFSWIVPAAVVVAVVGALFVPFLRRLPDATRHRFVAASLVYVSGALVTEIPLGIYADARGYDLGYFLIDFVEETLELTGATLFLVAILRHAAAHHPPLQLRS